MPRSTGPSIAIEGRPMLSSSFPQLDGWLDDDCVAGKAATTCWNACHARQSTVCAGMGTRGSCPEYHYLFSDHHLSSMQWLYITKRCSNLRISQIFYRAIDVMFLLSARQQKTSTYIQKKRNVPVQGLWWRGFQGLLRSWDSPA
jgi:hypothetical protein